MKIRQEIVREKLKLIMKLLGEKRGFYMGMVSLALATLALNLWVYPGYQSLKEHRYRLEAAQGQVALLESFRKAQDSFEARLQAAQLKQQQLKQIVRDQQDFSECLTHIQQEAQKRGIKVREIKKPEKIISLTESKGNSGKQYVLKLLLSGDYLTLLELMKALEQEQLQISNLRLSPESKGEKVLLEGQIKLYILENNTSGEKNKITR